MTDGRDSRQRNKTTKRPRGGKEAQSKRRPAWLRGSEEGEVGKEGKINDFRVQLGGDGTIPGNRRHWKRAKLAVGRP